LKSIQQLVRDAALKFLPFWTEVSIGTVVKGATITTSINSIITSGTWFGTCYYVVENLTNEYRIYYDLNIHNISSRIYIFWNSPTELQVGDTIIGSNLYSVYSATNYGLISIALIREFKW